MSGMPVVRLSAPLAAFLSLLLLAPDEARAQRNQCGALSSGAATCSDQAYASGIRYDVTGGWVNGVAGDVRLTIPGGSATTVTAPTAAGWGSGVVARTAVQGTGDSTTRTIALTIGAGTTAVAIVRSTNTNTGGFDNTGVAVHQRGNAADATTVTLGGGVTIGAEAAPMQNFGVHVLVETSTNTAAHKIESAATIHSTGFGLLMDNRGAGDSVVTNSGSITTTGTGGVAGQKSGIRVLDWSHSPPGSLGGDSRTASTSTTVTNSGSVTVSAANARGIEVNAEGLGLYKTVNSGTVSASGENGNGILVVGTYKTGAAGSKAIEIENSGHIGTSGAGGHGVYVETVDAMAPSGRGSGNVEIANSGSISTTASIIAADSHAVLVSANMGAVSVTNGGGVYSRNGDGVRVQQGGTGDVTVANSGAVRAENHGIFVEKTDGAGAGAVTVTNTGRIEMHHNSFGRGIRVNARGSGLYRIVHSGTISMSGNGGVGISVHAQDHTGAAGVDSIVIESSGDIAVTNNDGIYVNMAGTGDEDGETAGNVNVRVVTTGGKIENMGFLLDDGIHINRGYGAGNAAIVNKAAITTKGSGSGLYIASWPRGTGTATIANEGAVTSEGHGIQIWHGGTGASSVDNSGDVTAKEHAIYVRTHTWEEIPRHRKTIANAGELESTEADGIRVEQSGGSATVSHSGVITAKKNGITARGGGGSAVVSVAEGASVTGGEAGVYMTGAGAGLRIEKKYAPPAVQAAAANKDLAPEDFVTVADHLDQVVRVDGTVTGGSDAAVHLDGGGALIVGRTGRLVPGAGKPAVLVNDPGPAIIYIDGAVTGSAGSDAAVRMSGGGTVTIGGRVEANGATNAIQADSGRSEIVINGEVKGRAGGAAAVRLSGGTVTIGVNGRVDANGATNAIQADDTGGAVVSLKVEVAAPSLTPYRDEGDPAQKRLVGPVVGAVDNKVLVLSTGMDGRTGKVTTVTLASDGTLDLSGFEERKREETDTIDCAMSENRRCRLYNALPSALLSMNGLPSYGERMAAARSGGGGWALVEAASGRWKASRSPTDASVSYNRSRTGVRAGVDMAVGEDGRVGLSAHGLTGSAKMSGNGGKAAMTGVGLGLNATAQAGDGIYVDAQLAVTRYRTKLTSQRGATLKSGAKGTGYALALETGRSMSMGGDVSVTPRAGLAWSRVSLGKFMDMDDIAVAMKNAGSFTGAVGLAVETAPAGGPVLFGTLDVVQEFTTKTKTQVEDRVLEATAPATTMRVGVGGAFDLGDGASLRGSVGYETAGGGTNEFGGGLSLAVQF